MDYYKKIKVTFLAYFKKSIYNASIDYKRKLIKTVEKEVSLNTTFAYESLSHNSDDDFLHLSDSLITYEKLENLFSNKNYCQAMKNISNIQKQVLYLSIVEELQTDKIAEITGLKQDNVRKTKARAIKNFIDNLENLKGE